MMSNERIPLTPAPIRVPDAVLDDLRTRLRATRFADDTGNDDWYYGVAGNYLAELVEYWADGYDWRKAEAGINENEQYDVVIDGVPVHFMSKPGVGPNPTPLILTHGWPWTDQMWTKVMGPLADPGTRDALVILSRPGRSARQLHQVGAQATAASTRSAFVTESSPSQALMAPANPWATNCAMI